MAHAHSFYPPLSQSMGSIAHSGGGQNNIGGPLKYCHCGHVTPLLTSMTTSNLGRRFFGCGNYGPTRRECHYFEWFDFAPSDRGTLAVNNLLIELKNQKRKQRWLMVMLLLT